MNFSLLFFILSNFKDYTLKIRIFAQNLFEMIHHCIVQNLCFQKKSKVCRANKND